MNISTLPTRLAKDRQSVCGQAERVSPPKREIVRFSLGVWVNTYATVTFREVLSTTYPPYIPLCLYRVYAYRTV